MVEIRIRSHLCLGNRWLFYQIDEVHTAWKCYSGYSYRWVSRVRDLRVRCLRGKFRPKKEYSSWPGSLAPYAGYYALHTISRQPPIPRRTSKLSASVRRMCSDTFTMWQARQWIRTSICSPFILLQYAVSPNNANVTFRPDFDTARVQHYLTRNAGPIWYTRIERKLDQDTVPVSSYPAAPLWFEKDWAQTDRNAKKGRRGLRMRGPSPDKSAARGSDIHWTPTTESAAAGEWSCWFPQEI